MGIDLHIEDEKGELLYCMYDIQNLFMHIIIKSDMSSFSLLKYIDPYGDSVFNRMQLNDLIVDFSVLSETITDKQTSLYLNNMISTLKSFSNSIHTYFKFYGD